MFRPSNFQIGPKVGTFLIEIQMFQKNFSKSKIDNFEFESMKRGRWSERCLLSNFMLATACLTSLSHCTWHYGLNAYSPQPSLTLGRKSEFDWALILTCILSVFGCTKSIEVQCSSSIGKQETLDIQFGISWNPMSLSIYIHFQDQGYTCLRNHAI